MANSDKDIIITPNTGSSADDPKIEFKGADANGTDTLTLTTEFDGTKSSIKIDGSAGELFSVTNDLSGTIFSVNDTSGVPSVEVDNDGEIRLAEFDGKVGIGKSNPTQLLDVDGNIGISGTEIINSKGEWVGVSTGLKGASGIKGAKGATGLKGIKGASGLKGAKGTTGLKGAKGATGLKGAKGATGVKGIKGATGHKGTFATSTFSDFYDNTGGQNVTSGDVLNIDTTRQNSDTSTFVLSNDAITINATDKFLINFQVTTGLTSGDTRSVSKAYLQEWDGSSWSTVDGTTVYMYNRINNNEENTGSASLIHSVTAGNAYRIFVTRHSGNGTITTVADASRITIMNIHGGVQGPKGTGSTPGPAGAAGVKGLKGATGLKGSKGLKGLKGATGATGVKGAKGATGTKGASGAKGIKGASGATGTKGAKGASGIKGATGTKGAKGATGTKGAKGATGTKGAKGATGIKGASGEKGAKGATGIKGSKGAKGATGTKGAKGASGIKGATGDKGVKGATGVKGAKGASGIKGASGVKGAKGATGIKGASGEKGAKGATGLKGASGATGVKGAKGATGTKGAKGASGATGIKGAKGASGIKGASGQKGAKGATGLKGASGATGVKGAKGATGTKGAKGATGLKGASGATGVKGAKGATGTKGAKGASGTKGAKGATGIKGAKGASGLKGASGEKGTKGATGTKGTKGATGVKGTKGATGTKGAKGASGIKGASGVKGAKGASGIKGASGQKGAKGATGLKGASGATGVKGAKGATGTKGAKGASGIKGASGAKGAKGASGIKGASGAKGVKGATGLKGASGAKGAKGATGIKGETGAVGSAGNAIVFDVDGDGGGVLSDSQKAIDIMSFRGDNTVLVSDVYWHIPTGRVFSSDNNIGIKGATGNTGNITFEELSTGSGFLNAGGVVPGSLTSDKLAGHINEVKPIRQQFNKHLNYRIQYSVATGTDTTGAYENIGKDMAIPAPSLGRDHLGAGYGAVTLSKRQVATLSTDFRIVNKRADEATVSIIQTPEFKSKGTQSVNIGYYSHIYNTTDSRFGNESFTDVDNDSARLGDGVRTPTLWKFNNRDITQDMGIYGYISSTDHSASGTLRGARVLGVWYDGTHSWVQTFGNDGMNYGGAPSNISIYWSPSGFTSAGTWVSVGYGTTARVAVPKKSINNTSMTRTIDLGQQSSDTEFRLKWYLENQSGYMDDEYEMVYGTGGYGSCDLTGFQQQRMLHMPQKEFRINDDNAFVGANDIIAYDSEYDNNSSTGRFFAEFRDSFGTMFQTYGSEDTRYVSYSGSIKQLTISGATTPNVDITNVELLRLVHEHGATSQEGNRTDYFKIAVRGSFDADIFYSVTLTGNQTKTFKFSEADSIAVNTGQYPFPITTFRWTSDATADHGTFDENIVYAQGNLKVKFSRNENLTGTAINDQKGVDVKVLEVVGTVENLS